MINIVFLCYEITKGMKSFGPKALIPVGSKNDPEPLIIKQIKSIKKQYENIPHTIHVVVGFEQDRIIKVLRSIPQVKIIKYDHYNNSNSAGAVLMCLQELSGSVLFVENGILCSYRPKDNTCSVLPVCKKADKNNKFTIGVTTSDNKAEYLFYDLEDKWPEILFIHFGDVDHILRVSKDKNVNQMFLFEYINYLIEKGIVFHTDKISNTKVNKIINHKAQLNVNLYTK